jgi:hypothetical protein
LGRGAGKSPGGSYQPCTGFIFHFLSSNKIYGKAFAVLSKKKTPIYLSLIILKRSNLDLQIIDYTISSLATVRRMISAADKSAGVVLL